MDKGYSDYENHSDWNVSILYKIKENTDKILDYNTDKFENTQLKVELKQLTEKIKLESDKLRKATAILVNTRTFLFAIKEYTELYKRGTIEEYQGHLERIHSLAETALMNLDILENKNDS